jgi:putative Mg2+ transporter-C (MgtC) family protein
MEALSQVGALLQSGVLHLDLLGRLVLAAVLGGLVGLERELSGKPAGLRTNMLICVGAALLTDLSVRFPGFTTNDLVRADPARIAAQIVSGIGFLGAGTIIQARGSVTGLTTAATLWVVAAIGMAAGSGFHVEATGSTVLVLITLVPLGWLERWIHHRRSTHGIRLVVTSAPGIADEIEGLLAGAGLDVFPEEVTRNVREGLVTLTLRVTGPAEAFGRARECLIENESVQSFSMGESD